MLNQAKMVMKMKKIQKELSKEIVEVEAGDGAVVVRMTGEQKVKDIELDEEKIDTDDLEQVEKWLKSAITQAVTKSQQIAAEKMKSVGGGLNIPGM